MIPPGASFWVHAKMPGGSQITISDPGQAAPKSLPPPVLSWRVNLQATTGTYLDSGTYFACKQGADEEHDSSDVLEISPFSSEYIQAFFNHPEWGYYAAQYTQDTRPFPDKGNSVVWKLTIRATNADGYVNMSWSVPEEILTSWKIFICDESTGIIKDMFLQESYEYSALGESTREFTITAKLLDIVLIGDANLDGVVDELDALLCARAEHGLETLTPEQIYVADLDSDGKITVIDSLLILKKVKGYIK